MSVKDFFNEGKKQFLSTTSINELTGNLESGDYISAYVRKQNRFSPLIDFSQPANFARFGSAEKYYYDSINHIVNTYPYDGSKKEKVLWELSSSHLDLYLLDNGYPRFTGYAVFSTGSLTATDTSKDYTKWGSYGAAGTASYEYIFVNGGPHAGVGKKIYIDPDTGDAHYREDANIYSLEDNRECNLKIGGIDGNTVEFWLKKAEFNPDATQKEVIFDIHTTSSISSSAGYGRLMIEMSGTDKGTTPFYVTYMSGTDGFSNQAIGTSITTASVADNQWHHYAFRFKNSGSNVTTDLFIDGVHNHRVQTGTTIAYVSGTIVGTIGALATQPSGGTSPTPQATKGWGKLSGSIDEFRFWKTWRNSEQIQTRWFDQVGGGTNTDTANTHLGVYFKFNEGITLTSSIDEKVLDYSGRISNGAWTGYNSSYSRNTGSAINDANSTLTNFSGSEFRDPVIYVQNNDFKGFLSSKRAEGKEYDYTNPSSIYYSMPGWILDEHDVENTSDEGLVANSLWNLTQVIGSYFDDVAGHIKSMPELTQPTYFSGSIKAPPFMDRIVESSGFVTPEIFTALSALEKFDMRDETRIFTKDVSEIKNIIYRNIYNNLSYINKSKGVEKSFRNLIRCFGIDDEIYRFNVYSNNAEYVLENNYRPVSEQYKVINFNTTGTSEGVVFQLEATGNVNSVSYLSASGLYDTTYEGASLPFSVEANVVFPNRVSRGDYRTLRKNAKKYQDNYPLMTTSSLFGMHTADTGSSETTWVSSPYQDYANFLVRAVKDKTFGNKAYFILTGTEGGFLPALSSTMFDDVYSNSNWSFLVSLYPSVYPNANQVSGSDLNDYTVEFSGMQTVLDTTINEFKSTGSITTQQARLFLGSAKRVFAGAHRTNFSGGLRQASDVKFNSLRVWQSKLSTDELKQHSIDPTNFGVNNPAENAFLFNTSIDGVYVPKKETLLLHWNFDTVTGSDSRGKFVVEDLTSGSSSQLRGYGWFGNSKNKQFTGQGQHFLASSTDAVENEELITGMPNLPEVMTGHDMVNILTNDDVYFTRDKRPTFFDLYVEKSPYQNISSEMMKFIATAKDFNDLIGRPVDRYRNEYKDLSVLRNLFFQNVANEPDIDKYVEYFKWFDIAVTSMIQKLAPMSSGLDERPLRTVIESHILERSKYQSKFPTYEFKQSDPEGSIFGVNEMLYDWEYGHKPVAQDDQSYNCNWWYERAARTNAAITSGDANVDSNRQSILDVKNNISNTTAPILSASAGTYSGSAFALKRFARPYRIRANEQPFSHGGVDFNRNRKIDYLRSAFRAEFDSTSYASITSYTPSSSCTDEKKPNAKVFRDYEVDGIKDNFSSPFNILSSSVSSIPEPRTNLYGTNNDLLIANVHYDAYGPDAETPMQGPFTNAHVGGSQHRHVPMNTGSDSRLNRPELFRITTSGDTLNILNADQQGDGTSVTGDKALPRAEYYRNETAKRPVNIANISYDTGSAILGNFQHNYEVVLTNGVENNNRYFVQAGGVIPTASTDSYFLSGVLEYELPRRDLTGSTKSIIVNRFSAPGDPATMGQGMLDVLTGQYSIYNALPWRNWAVRQPQLELLTDHSKQFGYFSDAQYSSSWFRAIKQGLKTAGSYPGTSGSVDEEHYYADSTYTDATASFHKINRNGRMQPFLDESELDEYTNTKLLQFNGSGHDVNIGTAATWDALIGNAAGSNQKYTFSAWIYATALNHAGGGNFPRILDFGDQDIALLIRHTGELQLSNKFTTTNGEWITPAGTITTGKWIHVAVTYNANSTANDPIFYVDGQKVATVTETSTPVGTNYGIVSQDGYIGDRAAGSRNFSGYMDEISIWNDVLTGKEIEEIFLGSRNYIYRGGVGNLDHHSAVSKLISWWRSDSYTGGGSTILPDDKGSNNGTLADASMVIDNDGASVEKLLPVITYHEQTEKTYDNWFIQHQIPQTDVQYAWITASLVSDYSGSALYGFEQPDFSNASLASTDLTFASASTLWLENDSGTDLVFAADEKALSGDPWFNYNFSAVQTGLLNYLTASENFLGLPAGSSAKSYINQTLWNIGGGEFSNFSFFPTSAPSALHALINQRQGPWGGASWKIYKKDDHPIVRAHKQENRLSYLTTVKVKNSDGLIIPKTELTSVIEPAITSKFHPLVHRLRVKQNQFNDEATSVKLEHSYLNNVAYFNDHLDNNNTNLNDRILSTRNLPTSQQTLDVVNYYLFGGELLPDLNPVKEFQSLEITETVYPKAKNTYLSRTRQRENFKNNFWRTSRADRSSKDNGSLKPFINDGGTYDPRELDATASMWPLDARLDFTSGSPGRLPINTSEGCTTVMAITTCVPVSGGSDQAGVLQTNAGIFDTFTTLNGVIAGAQLLPQYNRRIPGTIASDSGSAAPAGRVYQFGDTLWEVNKATDINGNAVPRHQLIAPFYDSYDDYIDDLKRAAKNYGILPEYRISDHMDFFVNVKNGNFLAENTASFSITGSTTNLSSSTNSDFFKTYSHTDFLKTFKLVNTEYGDKTNVRTVTLSAEAAIKFLPYNGFYPAQRTVQLAKLWYEDYKESVSLTSSYGNTLLGFNEKINDSTAGFARPIFQSLFAPGILYNSIKSGVAVDYPVSVTASGMNPNFTTKGQANSRYATNGSDHANIQMKNFLKNIPRIDTGLNYRVPFEGLLDPEGYISGRYFLDQEPHPSASINNLTCSLGVGNPTYKLAMNNFLASTIDFFKPDGKLTTLASVADTDPAYGGNKSDGGGFKAGNEYTMRIVCFNGTYTTKQELVDLAYGDAGASARLRSASFALNPQTCVMYAQTGSNTALSQSDYWGSAFGPPMDAGPFGHGFGAEEDSNDEAPYYLAFSSASFEPFTPPYYDGYSHIELTFRPKFDGFIPMTEVVSQLTQSVFRWTTHQNSFGAGAGPLHAMQLSASMNYLQIADEKVTTFDPISGKPISVGGSSDESGQKLVIQPKWETPILNFKNAAPTLPVTGSGSIARGMWHQYGEIPQGDEGIWLQIQDIDEREFKEDGSDNPITTGSLADLLGFKKDPVRLGETAQQKVISEAIVAIPFVIARGEQQRYKISKGTFALAKEAERAGGLKNLSQATISLLTGELGDASPPAQSMIDMISKMKKFVIPPHLDFVMNDSIDPFAMFILDYSVTLQQTDLLNIWQNIAPEIGRTFQKQDASLPLKVFSEDNLTKKEIVEQGGATPLSFFSEDTQWMVFKVKERAAFNYFAKTADSRDDERFKFNFEVGSKGAEITSVPDYSYNWPFDFFSLIELAKIDATVTIEPTDDFKEPKKNYPKVTAEEIVKQTEVFGIPFAGVTAEIEKAEELNQPEPSPTTKNIVTDVAKATLETGTVNTDSVGAPTGIGTLAPAKRKKTNKKKKESLQIVVDKDKK